MPKVCCAIPVYNNKDTLRAIALECRKYLERVLVVDDGSTDCDVKALLADTDITVLRHARNHGKGRAIKSALVWARKQGFDYLITIDGDGQHYPRDLEKFLPLLRDGDPAIVIGCRNMSAATVPGRSRFGRDFSNFWFRLETGHTLHDCQSGFRAYPVEYISRLRLRGASYNFEAEVLAKAAWAGLTFKEVAVDVWYPPPAERVTHFRPFWDNWRFTLMHTRLVARRLSPWPHRRLVEKAPAEKFSLKMLARPTEVIVKLLREHATPPELAVSAAMGVLIGTLPLFSMHSLVIIYVAARLHLNKLMGLLTQNLSVPPFVPAVCVELGHYFLYGQWLVIDPLSSHQIFRLIIRELPQRVWEWFLGSLVIGPLLAVPCVLIVYFTARAMESKNVRPQP